MSIKLLIGFEFIHANRLQNCVGAPDFWF